MSTLSDARIAARALLKNVTGDERPMWRQVITEYTGANKHDAIAPVCLDDDHEPEDASVYSCCPEPVIEVEQPELGAYLVELLNADAEDGVA
ncbi:hypothetical protein [Streptomyces sp. NPDC051561]|uniref:hypothetical protein n=1 Tax=Streptomyces sp. NPDC051561 TaxID=3365658 RepID=UPI0037BAB499